MRLRQTHFVLLSEAQVGHLASMNVGIDEAWTEEASLVELDKLVGAVCPAVLFDDGLDRGLLTLHLCRDARELLRVDCRRREHVEAVCRR